MLKRKPFIENADSYFTHQFPASALLQLYEVQLPASLDLGGEGGAVLERMKLAYESLGRPFLADRVATHMEAQELAAAEGVSKK